WSSDVCSSDLRNMAVPFPVFADAGFQVFDHLERFAVLGLKFGDMLRQLGLGAYAVLRQKRHRLCRLLEVEHLGPALVTSAFARGQLGLDVDQATYFIRVRVGTAESGGFLALGILGEKS